MKQRVIVNIILITLLMTTSVSAEIYKYIDEKGQKRWTDDLSQVPQSQRNSVEAIESTQSEPNNGAVESQDNAPQTVSPAESASPNTEAASDAIDVTREALEKEKAALDTLYKELLTERKAIEQMNTDMLDSAARNSLNQRITAFNTKTAQYETQLDQFNAKINDFNQRIISKQPSAASE